MSSDVIALSCITYKKMMQNLVWATPYNVIAIPAAAGAFVRWGITLTMSLGALVINLLDCNRAGERAVCTSFETLT